MSTLTVDSEQDAERIYAALSNGGQIFMKMEKTHFANRFAMLRDKFGTSWMLAARNPVKELYNQASEVACYYRAYSSYRGSVRTATRALQRRMPANTAEECEVALQRALQLVDRCRALVDADWKAPPLVPTRKRSKETRPYTEVDYVSHLIPQAQADFPEFSDETLRSTLMFVVVYYHLR